MNTSGENKHQSFVVPFPGRLQERVKLIRFIAILSCRY